MPDFEELKNVDSDGKNIEKRENKECAADEEEYYEVVYSSSYSYEQQHDGPYASREEAEASADEFNRNQVELYENSGHLVMDVLKDYRTAVVRGPYKRKKKEDA